MTEEKVMEMLNKDEDFQNALKKYEEAEKQSSEKANELSMKIIESFSLQDINQTIENSRFNLLMAKMTAAKMLATLSSFSYEEKDFMDSLVRARECVQKEIVPTLMDVQPCGECEECKNGNKDKCLRPIVRSEYCESRFLPLLADALIEYDAWSEILYNHIPQEKRDIDVLKDMNEEFQDSINIKHKKKGRPPKATNIESNDQNNE